MSTNINVNLTKNEWNVLNLNIELDEPRRKRASILRYLKKHITLNGGVLRLSLAKIIKMYNRYHKNMTRAHLKNVVDDLSSLGLINIEKEGKVNIYTLPKDKKIDNGFDNGFDNQKPNQSIDMSSIESNSEKLGFRIYDKSIPYTDKKECDSIISKIKKLYRGIKPSLKASKKDLYNIAESLLVAKRLDGKKPYMVEIQKQVFLKLKYSQVTINICGAAAYIDKIIEEKLDLCLKDENLINAENNIPYTRFNDFGNQRSYDYDELELKLLGWE